MVEISDFGHTLAEDVELYYDGPADQNGETPHLKVVIANDNGVNHAIVEAAYATLISTYEENTFSKQVEGDKVVIKYHFSGEEDSLDRMAVIADIETFYDELGGAGIWCKAYFCYAPEAGE